MRRTFLRSKIHRARVTEIRPDYEGSLCLDVRLMRAAGLLPYERVEVYNVTNGERFATYLIRGAEGSGIVGVYGAAALKVGLGHVIIIAAYAELDEGEIDYHAPVIVLVDEKNAVAARTSG